MPRKGIRLRALVVEDEGKWRSGLCDLFGHLPGLDVEVGVATNQSDAVRQLDRGRWDLLVLDILLGEGGDGRPVLEKAKENGACRGVIVVTGMHQKDEIDLVEGGRALRITLVDYLGRIFPSRSRCFLKESSLTLAENLATIRRELSVPDILRLCGLVNSFRKEGGYWVVTWDGSTGRFPHRVGLDHIQRLLRRQGEVLSLGEILPADPEDLAAVPYDPDAGVGIAGLAQIAAKYKQLQEELKSAEDRGDEDAASRIEGRLVALCATIEKPVRGEHPILKRARDRVSKAIKRAIRPMRPDLPALCSHLDSSLRLGKSLSYLPPEPTSWTFE